MTLTPARFEATSGLREFVGRSHTWLSDVQARTETVASTVNGSRAVVEVLVHMSRDGEQLDWPVAAVTESPDDRTVVFRSYYSQQAVDTRHHHIRPPVRDTVLDRPPDVVRDYRTALAAGDVDAAVAMFAPDAYYREPFGPRFTHRGIAALRSFFEDRFAAGAIDLQVCAVTDDGVRCAAEYNCVSWGEQLTSPQAGIAVFEPNHEGLITAVRVYDDLDELRQFDADGQELTAPHLT